jgi:hypothetical protein
MIGQENPAGVGEVAVAVGIKGTWLATKASVLLGFRSNEEGGDAIESAGELAD